ncbi:NAD-dependent dehydratase [Planctomycetaceae bacterium SCGC AG-212-F19]|nr:NAD-dependent dehydratase [Planctomycetaceae bacterium SCGC AG-212-F19]
MTRSPRALVTGGAGFIGSHMVDLLLRQGFQVRVVDNLAGGRLENLAHHKADNRLTVCVRDVMDLKPDDAVFEGLDYVFHFAGIGDIVPSIDRPGDYMRNNVLGTVSVLEGARRARVQKFVYAASSSCYGATAPVPTTEEAPVCPEYPYALSKYQGEQAVLHWGKVYRLPVVALRLFNVYGPRSRTTGAYGAVFGVFLAQKLAGKPFTVVGDGTQRRDFVFATDLARAFLAAAESAVAGEVFNVGTGNPQSVNRLVELLGGNVVHIPKRPGEPDCTWADIAKIRGVLGWQPAVSFEEGVAALLQNIDYWRTAPLWDPQSIAVQTHGWFACLSGGSE